MWVCVCVRGRGKNSICRQHISFVRRLKRISWKMECFRTISRRCRIMTIFVFRIVNAECARSEIAEEKNKIVCQKCVMKTLWKQRFNLFGVAYILVFRRNEHYIRPSVWCVRVNCEVWISWTQVPLGIGLVAVANTTLEPIWIVPHRFRAIIPVTFHRKAENKKICSMLRVAVRGSSIITRVCAHLRSRKMAQQPNGHETVPCDPVARWCIIYDILY